MCPHPTACKELWENHMHHENTQAVSGSGVPALPMELHIWKPLLALAMGQAAVEQRPRGHQRACWSLGLLKREIKREMSPNSPVSYSAGMSAWIFFRLSRQPADVLLGAVP